MYEARFNLVKPAINQKLSIPVCRFPKKLDIILLITTTQAFTIHYSPFTFIYHSIEKAFHIPEGFLYLVLPAYQSFDSLIRFIQSDIC